MPNLFLDIRDDLAGIGLIPTPVQVLGSRFQRKAGEAERVEIQGGPTTQPDGTADAIRTALSELIRLDR